MSSTALRLRRDGAPAPRTPPPHPRTPMTPLDLFQRKVQRPRNHPYISTTCQPLEWWVVCACAGATLLLCAGAGALAHSRLRRHCAAAVAATATATVTATATATANPMLSVQVPGRAGMDRLGAPGPPRHRQPHRHHTALDWEEQQAIQAMVGRLVDEMVEKDARARSAAAAERLALPLPLPPSIQLPDGEFGQDAHLQLRVPYQQAELTRSSFTAPPNKSVSDVPEWAGAEAGAARRAGGGAGGGSSAAAGKKDGLLQKASRWWWVRLGAARPQYLPPLDRRPAAPPPPPPCVMVPRRAPPRA